MGDFKKTVSETESINRRIFYYRKLANLTQNETADLLGMKHSTYSQMERKGNISVEMLLRLARIFHVRPEVFFSDQQELHQPVTRLESDFGINFIPTHNDIQVMTMFHNMLANERKRVMEFMDLIYHEKKERKKTNND